MFTFVARVQYKLPLEFCLQRTAHSQLLKDKKRVFLTTIFLRRATEAQGECGRLWMDRSV